MTVKRYSGMIDIKKLERETFRWLYLGFLIAVLFHAVLGFYSMRIWRIREAGFLKTAVLKRQPIPIKMIVRRRPGGPFVGFRVARPEYRKHSLGPLRRSSSKRPLLPVSGGITLKRPSSLLNELSMGGISVQSTNPIFKDAVNGLEYVPEGIGLNDDGIRRVERYHFSLTDELISMDDLDYGRYKAQVIIDPNDYRNIRGYLHLPLGVSPFGAGQVRYLYDFVLSHYSGIDLKIDNATYLSSRDIFKYPFLYMMSPESFELTEHEKHMLRDYLLNGGFVFLEIIPDEEISSMSARLLFKELFGRDKLEPLSINHELYHCYYDISQAALFENVNNYENFRTQRNDILEGLYIGKRLALVYSEKNIGGKWNKLGSASAMPSIQLGVNIIVYALRQKGGTVMKMVDNSTETFREIDMLISHNPADNHMKNNENPALWRRNRGE